MSNMESHNCENRDVIEPWNLWEIQPPPYVTVKTLVHHNEIEGVRNIICKAIATLENTTVFHKEIGFLSRYLYRYKRIFRRDKGMQFLVKMYQALRRYLKLDLVSILIKFRDSIPNIVCSKPHYEYLPTQQMLKFVLLRIQSFGKIFSRIFEVSKSAGRFIYANLSLGRSISYMLPALAIASRIFVCSKIMLIESIEWYDSLRDSLAHFKCTANFLSNYEFPIDFKSFLGDVNLRPLEENMDVDEIFESIYLCVRKESDFHVKFQDKVFPETDECDSETNMEEVSVDETNVSESGKRKDKRKNEIQLLAECDSLSASTSTKHQAMEDLGTPVKRKNNDDNNDDSKSDNDNNDDNIIITDRQKKKKNKNKNKNANKKAKKSKTNFERNRKKKL